MKEMLFSQQIENMHESQSESFNVSREGKNNRKIKRKGKKIIHNCCILIKKPNGCEEIIVRQFHDICKLKTTTCIKKKTNEFQIQKDSAVAEGMLSKLKKLPDEKKEVIETQSFENKAPPSSVSNELFEKGTLQLQEAITTQYYYPSFFYMVAPSYSYQLL